MRLEHRVVVLCALMLSCACTTGAAVNQFSPGDILVTDFEANRVQQYSPAGVLLQTFTGSGTQWGGVALAPNGNLVVAHRSNVPDDNQGGVDVFSPSGVQVGTFSTPQVGVSADVSVFADGVLAITDLVGPTQEYTQPGAFVRTLPQGPGTFHNGTAVARTNGSLWTADASANELINQSETGAILQTVNVPFTPRDLVVAGDG